MKRNVVLIFAIMASLCLLVAAGVYAAKTVADDIEMKNKAYEKHKKGIVIFTHKKHAVDYAEKSPELYKNGCGECHHDKEGKPLCELKDGDDVESCIDCHKIPSERPKGKDAPKLTKKQRLEYHAEALHYNCKGCHKKFNKANNTKAAPTTCTKCHPKMPKNAKK